MKKIKSPITDGSIFLGASALISCIEHSVPGPHYYNLFVSLSQTLKYGPLSEGDWFSFKEALESKRKQLKQEGGLQQEILFLINHLVRQEKLFQFDPSKGFFWNQEESHNSKKLEELRIELIKVKPLQDRWQKERLTPTPFLSEITNWLNAALNLLGQENRPASVEYFSHILRDARENSKLIPLLSDSSKISQLNAAIRDLMLSGKRTLNFKTTTFTQSSTELQLQLEWLDKALAWADQLPHERAGVITRFKFAFG